MDDYEMYLLLEFFHLEHDYHLLYVDLQILQAWLVVASLTKFQTVSTMLFHEYGRAIIAVTNVMSRFSMFVPTKATLKLDNGNTGHAKGIGIILCSFTNCSIIYQVGPVYYFPVHPSNTISSAYLKIYVGFQKGKSEPLEHCDLPDSSIQFLKVSQSSI